ncbi:winged helix-turn-helix transcriptional regulator [Nocardiopsis suaedae]|uniref:Winged helix-turn-helix transcriptional regulator n=1 Tax=Nocardiopsis suaedae TaxID=3018444 RepID=A0ABT4TKL7_9ACTN|nr:winged helix-turn-helix transcriptional regulator [Nocardiopsis suaedae]MDA2805238.1 winged helix-turn-helix transcriptional regulator [Nocardiopsis suaedae]
MPRRSYDQYCAVSRALDAVGERWTLLVARELQAGPRRYTDLHADLPGVSTDVLASRLRDMERDGLVARRPLTPRGGAALYELTGRGRALLPVLRALADWGAPALEERRPTDAFRAHWLAPPLLGVVERACPGASGTVEVRLETGVFHVRPAGPGGREGGYGDGPAERPDAVLVLSEEACVRIVRGALTPAEAVARGEAAVEGDGSIARALGAGEFTPS